MSKVVIGDYIVDLNAHRMFSADTELTVEPKVIEVLCYLIAQRERFVSLSELHDKVWAGRIVTDTAVRKTISKLRQLLNDTDAENPQFIKSQMKRGYQFICPVGPIIENSAHQVTDTKNAATQSSGEVATAWPARFKALLIALSLLLFSVVYFTLQRSEPKSAHLFKVETLLTIPGQKSSLTVSKDGRYHAFVARADSEGRWELHLYDAVAGQLQKIATPEGHCRFVSFIENDKLLAFVIYNGNEAKLYTQSIDNLDEPASLRPTSNFQLLGDVVALTNHHFLIAAAKSLEDNFHYYRYDVTTNSYEQFTYSSDDGIQDVFAALSPNKQLLALGRANIHQRHVMLQVYRVANKELVAEYMLQNNLQDLRLSWVDNDTVLTRSGVKHNLVNIVTGDFSQVEAEPHPLFEFSLSDTNELYGLSYEITPADIYQASWPLTNSFSKSYQIGTAARQLSYGDDADSLWLVEKTPAQNVYRLYRYAEKTHSRHVVMESSVPFRILEVSSGGTKLLLRRNNRLEVYNTISAEFTPVSITTQDVKTANFSQSGEEVYFTERVKEQWQVTRFNLADKVQTTVLQDYMFVQDIVGGYVAADSTGRVWLLDKSYQQTTLLYSGLFYNLEYQLSVRGERLMAAFRNLMGEWTLVDINLVSKDVWQKNISFYEFSLPFFIDSNGQNVIYQTYKKEEFQLVKYGYNFGYNLVSQ